MDYKPLYVQPFTLTEATALDVAVISEEISRLHNSVQRLNNTQSVLEKVIHQPGGADPEICQAFEENKTVIASQQERITMLGLALREKGVVSGSHYSTPPVQHSASKISDSRGSTDTETHTNADTTLPEVDNGVYL